MNFESFSDEAFIGSLTIGIGYTYGLYNKYKSYGVEKVLQAPLSYVLDANTDGIIYSITAMFIAEHFVPSRCKIIIPTVMVLSMLGLLMNLSS